MMSSDIFYTDIDLEQLLPAIMLIMLIGSVIALALAVTMYVLSALGLYKVARRRGIKHSWLAWIPCGNYWILGSVADHYRRVSLERNSNRRVLLIVLVCTYLAISGLQIFFAADMVMTILENAETMDMYELEQMLYGFEQQVGTESSVNTLLSVLSLATMIFYYICLHDFYLSCRPANKTLYLVLSILFPVTEPFFIFNCRYADIGMPHEEKTYTLPPDEENQEEPPAAAETSVPAEDSNGGLWRDC